MDIKEATIQELNLELMRRATFNGYNGDKVVKSLNAHKELWRAVLMDSPQWAFNYEHKDQECIDLLKLRDLEDNYWNVDTIFIIPADGKTEELLRFAKRNWRPEDIHIVEVEKARKWLGGAIFPLIQIWWD